MRHCLGLRGQQAHYVYNFSAPLNGLQEQSASVLWEGNCKHRIRVTHRRSPGSTVEALGVMCSVWSWALSLVTLVFSEAVAFDFCKRVYTIGVLHSCFVIIPVQRSRRGSVCSHPRGQSFKIVLVDSYGICAAFLWEFFETSKCRLQNFPDLIPEPDRGIFLCVDILCFLFSVDLGFGLWKGLVLPLRSAGVTEQKEFTHWH